MQRALLLDVVVRQRAAIFQLLTCEDQALLIRRDAFLVLDLALGAVNGVTRLHIKGDGPASHHLGEDLHTSVYRSALLNRDGDLGRNGGVLDRVGGVLMLYVHNLGNVPKRPVLR